MLLTFGCPRCGKEFDLPWSLAGKKARCKQCDGEFVIPAPFEPKGPRSSEAIPVFDPKAQPKSAAALAEDRPPTQLFVAPRSGQVGRTMKIEAPLRPPPKARSRPEQLPTRDPVEPPLSRTPPPAPRLDDPLAPTKSQTSRKAERPRPRARPRRDLDDFESDVIDPVTGSRKRPDWLIPTFVIADLVIILIVIGQIAAFVGGDADDGNDEPPVRRSVPREPVDQTNFEPAQLPNPVPSAEPSETQPRSPSDERNISMMSPIRTLDDPSPTSLQSTSH